MEKPVVGSVVVLLFPFSDLRGAKRRPALILATTEFGNFILCQITSKPYASKTAITLVKDDFMQGSLPVVSYIRPDKLFTADASLFAEVKGQISKEKLTMVRESLKKLFHLDEYEVEDLMYSP